MATQGMCDSFKVEIQQAAHCFNVTVTATCTTATSFVLTSISSMTGIAVGQAVTGTNIAAGSVVASIDSGTQVTLSKATTGSATNTMTFTSDIFKMVLIKTSPVRTFDHTQTNVGTPGSGAASATNVGTDETTNTSGTGYTSGGGLLTNVTPVLSSTTACGSFANVSWTSSTFTTSAGIIQNTSTRLGASATPFNGRTIAVYDFGAQSVTAGTLTLVMPAQTAGNALLQIA